jgi:hypothetical protein
MNLDERATVATFIDRAGFALMGFRRLQAAGIAQALNIQTPKVLSVMDALQSAAKKAEE